MPAAIHNILIEQGSTFKLNLTWKDSDDVPVDLTGYSARMQVRPTVESSDVLLNLNTANGSIVLGGDAGTIAVTAAATQTEKITGRRAVYDLEVEASNGVVTRLLQGAVAISLEVTR